MDFQKNRPETIGEGQKNKGFTLVEVLVAMIILGIIVVPLLQSFVVASRVNAKAKKTMQATTIAQNLMEELKAYPLDDILDGMNGGSSEAFSSYADKHESKVTLVTQPDGTSVSSMEDTTNASAVGEDSYSFTVKDISLNGSRTTYDARIDLTKSSNSVNNDEIADVIDMASDSCGYYAQSTSFDNLAASKFEQLNEAMPVADRIAERTASGFLENMTRTITIEVARDASDSNHITAKVTYTYDAGYGYTQTADRYYTSYSTIFDSYTASEDLEAVYLYYYPLYGGIGRDNVVVANTADLDIDVFLVRMKTDDTSVQEATYHPSVVVQESSAGSNGLTHTNLCSNIKDRWSVSTTPSYGCTSPVHDLVNSQTSTRLYDVTITIFESGENMADTGNKVLQFTGSYLN